MEKNVGQTDKTIRYIIAIVLVVLAAIFNIYWLIIPAGIVAVTAYMGKCGIYKLFGCSTCKVNNK